MKTPNYRSCAILVAAFGLLFALLPAQSQTLPVAPMPAPQYCPRDANGAPYVGGLVYTSTSGGAIPLATYTDATHTVQNANPVVLNSLGCAGIWLQALTYRIRLTDSSGAQVFSIDGISDPGALTQNLAVLLTPTGQAMQTILGPLTANYFTGATAHTTSPNVRVALLAPVTTLDTSTNPPTVTSISPAVASQNYNVPDPTTLQANFVLNPGEGDWQSAHAYLLGAKVTPVTTNPCGFTFYASVAGTSGNSNPTFSTAPCSASPATVADNTVTWTKLGGNVLDCTLSAISCLHYGFASFGGGGCNNATAFVAWDNFATNAPDAICVTGTNVQKGVMAMRSAATKYQENTGTGTAGTCLVTYPQATLAGDQLIGWTMLDSTRTVSSATDGTNAYTAAATVTSGVYRLSVYYFNGSSTAMAAASTLTFTYSAAANAVCGFMAYKDVKTSGALDVTATNSGSGTAVTTGTTAGTAQNTELVLSFVGSASNPTVAFQTGTNGHSTVSQSTNVTGSSEGSIVQASGTQAGSFTLGTSNTWLSAIVTLKANVAGSEQAQQTTLVPTYYQSSMPLNANVMWQTPSAPTGTSTAVLGTQLVCSASGSTDDPAFLTATTATITVPTAAANTLGLTPLANILATGCAAGNNLHIQFLRQRYNAADTYEGYIYVGTVAFDIGTK